MHVNPHEYLISWGNSVDVTLPPVWQVPPQDVLVIKSKNRHQSRGTSDLGRTLVHTVSARLWPGDSFPESLPRVRQVDPGSAQRQPWASDSSPGLEPWGWVNLQF